MSRTNIQTIAGIFAAASVLTFGFAGYLSSSAEFLVPVGFTTILTFALVDLLIFSWVISISPRLPKIIKKDGEAFVVSSKIPLPPLVAARTVAFALAGSRVGSLLAGGYFGLALVDFQNLHAVAYVDHAKFSLLAVVLASGLVLISTWLERKCSPPNPKTSNE